jgi:hypothetical protein
MSVAHSRKRQRWKKISAVADNDVAIGFDGFFDFVLIDQPRIG